MAVVIAIALLVLVLEPMARDLGPLRVKVLTRYAIGCVVAFYAIAAVRTDNTILGVFIALLAMGFFLAGRSLSTQAKSLDSSK